MADKIVFKKVLTHTSKPKWADAEPRKEKQVNRKTSCTLQGSRNPSYLFYFGAIINPQ